MKFQILVGLVLVGLVLVSAEEKKDSKEKRGLTDLGYGQDDVHNFGNTNKQHSPLSWQRNYGNVDNTKAQYTSTQDSGTDNSGPRRPEHQCLWWKRTNTHAYIRLQALGLQPMLNALNKNSGR
ncbi:hypothetical protein CBL_07898 [Carabus blaptoides fortunei]